MKKIYLFQLLVLGSFVFSSNAMDIEKEKLKVEKEKVKVLQQIFQLALAFQYRYADRTQVEFLKNTNIYSTTNAQKTVDRLKQTDKYIAELTKQFATSSDSEPVAIDDLLLLDKKIRSKY